MPTKLNRAGNQQNYVPAGNGDARGEYGDNATGSNKNFQAIKRENRLKLLNNKTSNNKIKELISKVSDKLTPEGTEIIDYMLGKHADSLGEIVYDDNKSSLYDNYDKSISLSEEAFNRNWENEGQALIHELAHHFTTETKIEVDGKKYPIGLAPIFENRQSFSDVIKKEAQSLNRTKNIDIIRQEKDNALNKELEKIGATREEYDNLNNLIKQQPEYQIRLDKIRDDFRYGRITRKEAYKRLDNIYNEIQDAFPNTELAKKCERYQLLDKTITNARNGWYKSSGIANVSDMLSSNTYKGGTSGFGIGHNPNYYKYIYNYYGENKNDNYAQEFISNTLSAIATGNNAEIEATKKYLPKSYEAFTYLINKYYKGEK